MIERNKGLSSIEAKKRLKKHGPNILPEKPPPSSLSIFLRQLKNPLVYVLLAAGIVTLFLGDFSDTAIIFFVVITNSILGFVQEKKANSSLEALKALVRPTALIYRDGKPVKVEVESIVPGDMVSLNQGDKIPADGEFVTTNRLFIEEAVLTGESVPVGKEEGSDAYMGTIVSSGNALIKVTLTGAQTQMGKIALSVQKPREDTPLTKQLKFFSNQLTILVVTLTLFVFIVGLLTGKETVEIFKTSVALAVSAIPEGLLVALTVVLAVGMQRILKKKGLVRNLVSAETLGGVTTICVDKTGTLTHGKLKVVAEFGEVEKVCLQHFASLQDPIVIAAEKWLKKHTTHFDEMGEKFNKNCKVIDSLPFVPQNRFYASLVEHKDKNKEIYISGAPENLLNWSMLSDSEVKKIEAKIKTLTTEGKRVIGMAKKDVPETVTEISADKIKRKLEWVGLLAFTDPIRSGVKKAFKKTEEAGIRSIVITGDYAETALAVMRELQMDVADDNVMLGDDLEKMSEAEVSEKLKNIYRNSKGAILFARTKPQQKLKVINALKRNNEIVAMMGDGVNDAPALHRADIGIVVAEASDVAKESADMVLMDSSFETIVETIREGRGIFDNIRKIILYLLSDSFEEIIAVVGSIVLRLPIPVTAVQILWINIVSDGFPHLSLTIDPKDKEIMSRPPRLPKEPLVSFWMRYLVVIVSVAGGVIALMLFAYFYKTSHDLVLSRSVAFAALGINSLVYVFSIRTLTEPFWKRNPLENKWLNLSVMVGVVFQVLPFATPTLRSFFKVTTLTPALWLVVFGASIIMFIIIEVSKYLFRGRLTQAN